MVSLIWVVFIVGCFGNNVISLNLNKEYQETFPNNNKIKFVPSSFDDLLPFRNKSLPIASRVDDLVITLFFIILFIIKIYNKVLLLRDTT